MPYVSKLLLQHVNIDLHLWSECWYDQLGLIVSYTYRHVVPAVYTRWMTDRHGTENRKQIKLRVELFDENLIFNHYDVQCWGLRKYFIASEMLLVNKNLARLFTSILPENVEKNKR